MLKFLTDALMSPVTGPVHGFEFILNSIKDQVESEALDESKVQGELMQLGLRAQAGEIDDAEYQAQEDALLAKLNEIRRLKQQLEGEGAALGEQGEAEPVAEQDEAALANEETASAGAADGGAGA